MVVRKSKNRKKSAVEELSYENCVLNNLFRQISVYINRTDVGIINLINPPNFASYIQFMLMNSMSYLKLRDLAIGLERKMNTDTNNILRDVRTKALHLVGKLITKYLIYLNGCLELLKLI